MLRELTIAVGLMCTSCCSQQSITDAIPYFDSKKFDAIEPAIDASHHRIQFDSLQEVNDYANAFQYIPERKGDNWMGPEEFIRMGGGDCEDFAIFKYYLVLDSHLAEPKNLDLALAYDNILQKHHVVLIVNNMVLDNNTNEIKPIGDTISQYRYLGRVEHANR